MRKIYIVGERHDAFMKKEFLQFLAKEDQMHEVVGEEGLDYGTVDSDLKTEGIEDRCFYLYQLAALCYFACCDNDMVDKDNSLKNLIETLTQQNRLNKANNPIIVKLRFDHLDNLKRLATNIVALKQHLILFLEELKKAILSKLSESPLLKEHQALKFNFSKYEENFKEHSQKYLARCWFSSLRNYPMSHWTTKLAKENPNKNIIIVVGSAHVKELHSLLERSLKEETIKPYEYQNYSLFLKDYCNQIEISAPDKYQKALEFRLSYEEERINKITNFFAYKVKIEAKEQGKKTMLTFDNSEFDSLALQEKKCFVQ